MIAGWKKWIWIGGCAGALIACGRPTPTPAPQGTAANGAPTPVQVASPSTIPTFTPEPLAAMVNGESIPLATYETEVERCRVGKSSAGLDAADCAALALQGLIEQKMVEQAARAAGLTVSDSEVESALAQVVTRLGGPQSYQAWLTANLYTDEEFRDALRRDQLRAQMAEQVTNAVGATAEQVHAQALLVADEATAQDLLAQLKRGADFATLAVTYSLDLSSRVAGGDLGWFPRGLLTVPEVEEAAFALQPGETSEVIRSAMGYHIVQVLERDPARLLSPGAEQTLRARAYETWLTGVLEQAVIKKFVTP